MGGHHRGNGDQLKGMWSGATGGRVVGISDLQFLTEKKPTVFSSTF